MKLLYGLVSTRRHKLPKGPVKHFDAEDNNHRSRMNDSVSKPLNDTAANKTAAYEFEDDLEDALNTVANGGSTARLKIKFQGGGPHAHEKAQENPFKQSYTNVEKEWNRLSANANGESTVNHVQFQHNNTSNGKPIKGVLKKTEDMVNQSDMLQSERLSDD